MKKFLFLLLTFALGLNLTLAENVSLDADCEEDTGVCTIDFGDLQKQIQTDDDLFCEETTGEIAISLFHSPTCPHCKEEKTWLLELAHERGDINLHFYDVSTPEGYEVYEQFTEMEGLQKVVPYTLVNNTVVQGFDTVENTGAQILGLVDEAKMSGHNLYAQEFIDAGGSEALGKEQQSVSEKLSHITLPLIGKTVDLSWMPLPMLSMTLGFIDGFNPCAMWVLVTFLMILAQLGDRKRMVQIAGIFILAEAVMYYLILNVWFYTWNFVQLNQYIVPIVALISIGGGAFFLWEWKQGDGTCKVTNAKQRAQISKRINLLANAKMGFVTVLSIIALALSVNVIEFACSVGIPQMFTKVLDLNQLGFWAYQGLMGLYILFYMVDDVIVFGIALIGMEYIGLTTKYIRYTNLIGGILMILLGIVMMFKPEMLVF